MINVKLYNSESKDIWDKFVEDSKNGTFMLKRDYMDYHADRFKDFSLMFYEDEKLIALMPASLHEQEVRSHGGLTYGGIVSNRKMTASKMLEVFAALNDFLYNKGIKNLVYKCIPRIYHSYFADEDLYALFVYNAQLIRRDISTTIKLDDKIPFAELRRRSVKKALKNGLEVCRSQDYEGYVSLLSEVLSAHHGTKPVHTGAELRLLAERFPENIKLFSAYKEDKMLAGVVIFDTPQTVHAQYIANSDEGRNIGALDLVIDYLINTCSAGKKYFDFGISTEDNGRFLNAGLISQKEGFGGRATVYDFYELRIKG